MNVPEANRRSVLAAALYGGGALFLASCAPGSTSPQSTPPVDTSPPGSASGSAGIQVTFFAAAVALGSIFLYRAFRLWREGAAPEASTAQAIRLYRYSITYLTILFAAVALDTIVRV